MCGIAGALSLTAAPADAATVDAMIGVLRHRGPDDSGVLAQDRMALGHARLSILDLPGGRQPMRSQDGSLWITFNGEIFNYVEIREELAKRGHRFATASDTEVLLRLFEEEGDECVHRLNGQWAFAIWDARKQRLFLSRDRMGVRPVFYTRTAREFLFASEIKALFRCPRTHPEVDLRALDQIFTFWFTLPSYTAFKNVRQLPPGHSLVVEDGRVTIWRYWQVEHSEEFDPRDEDTVAEDLLALILDATRLRLRSDVPVGTYLSGGLDSTLVTALAAPLAGSRLNSFSVRFEDGEFDESEYQREATAFLHTEHQSVRCSRDDIARAFPAVVWHAEQPLLRAAPAPLFLLSRRVRDLGFKVVLTGEGADEILGGYDIFKEAKIRWFWAREGASLRRPLLLKRLYPYVSDLQRQPRAYLERFFRVTPADVASPFFSHLPRWEVTQKLKACFSADVRAELSSSCSALEELESALPRGFRSMSPFARAEHLETTGLLPGYILSSQGDRMSMAHSVEGRYPFLDHRVVEFAARLPAALKMKVLDEKHLLKRSARGLVPERIRTRHKQPYRSPDGVCFFTPPADYARELLSPERIAADGVFDSRAVSLLVGKFTRGAATSARDNMALVGVLSTQLLLDAFAHRRGRAPESPHDH